MKLIGLLLGVLLAISPVIAAKPGTCTGKIPKSTVAKCDKGPCMFEYVKFTVDDKNHNSKPELRKL